MRKLTTAALTALQSSSLKLAIFVEMHFKSSIARVWSGVGPVTWNSQTWLGVGNLGSVSTIEDGNTVEARGISLTVSGLPTLTPDGERINWFLADALQDIQVGLPAMVWIGLWDNGSPPALIDDVISAWVGRIDQPTIEVGGQSVTITLACENRLLDMNVPCDRRYTHSDQQISHPGDLGFSFVNSIQEITLYWGRTPVSGNNI